MLQAGSEVQSRSRAFSSLRYCMSDSMSFSVTMSERVIVPVVDSHRISFDMKEPRCSSYKFLHCALGEGSGARTESEDRSV